jgi:hypothetical protein
VIRAVALIVSLVLKFRKPTMGDYVTEHLGTKTDSRLWKELIQNFRAES